MTGIIENGTIRPAVLVLGAGGDIGVGVVEAAVEARWAVIAVDADEDALQRLRDQFPAAALTLLAAPLLHPADAVALGERLRTLDARFDGVVSSLAGHHPSAPLIQQPDALLRHTLDHDLLPHLSVARQLLPLLAHRGTGRGYVLIGGPGGDYPWVGYGHCSIAAAALRMMARVLHDEACRHGLRVQLLSLRAPVRTRTNAGTAGGNWPSARSVGHKALALLRAGPGVPCKAIVDVGSPATRRMETGQACPQPPSACPAATTEDLPVRDLRDARALLASLYPIPPSPPGFHPHDEFF